MTGLRTGERGFSLVSTLFILVVLAALGAYMVRLSTTQHLASAASVQSTRAWFAALGGLDWAVYRIRTGGVCPPVPSTIDLGGFDVRLARCDEAAVQEGADHYSLFDVEVVASKGAMGTADRVARRVRATVSG